MSPRYLPQILLALSQKDVKVTHNGYHLSGELPKDEDRRTTATLYRGLMLPATVGILQVVW